MVRGYHVHFHESGWAYLATVIDGFSRKVVGWAIADHMREELVIEAFRGSREPSAGNGQVIFHSDRGSQYTGQAFRDVCLEWYHTVGREDWHLL